jgi:hypothetical protein
LSQNHSGGRDSVIRENNMTPMAVILESELPKESKWEKIAKDK